MPPLAWVRQVLSELPEWNTIPLFGHGPSFDWSHISSSVASRFGVAGLKVRSREEGWRDSTEIQKALGANPLVLPVTLAPLGTAFWIMAREDMGKLTSWTLKPGAKTKAISSEILQEGFYRYLILEALSEVQAMKPLEGVTLQISEEEGPSEKAFCVDVQIEFEGKSCWGRLAIPAPLRTSWIRHFSEMPSQYISSEIGRQTSLILGVKTASVVLTQEEWGEIEEGDFVLLDSSSYNPQKESGTATLVLGAIPLFHVKIKSHKMELVDYVLHPEDMMEPTEKSAEEEVSALKELPLQVTVELARFKMSLDQLMHLSKGNTLELPIHPDQGVSLVVSGKKVGRAELIYLGEQLGLRILEIG